MSTNPRRRVPPGRPDGGQFAAGPAAVAAHLPGIGADPSDTELLCVGVGAGLGALLPAASRRRLLTLAPNARAEDRVVAGRRGALNLHAARDARHQGRLTPARAAGLEAEARVELAAARRSFRTMQALVNERAVARPGDLLPRTLLDRFGFQLADLAGAFRRVVRARADRLALAGASVGDGHPWHREAVAQARLRVADPNYRGAMHAEAWQTLAP